MTAVFLLFVNFFSVSDSVAEREPQFFPEKLIISSVSVSGNEVTKDFIILREIDIEPGQRVTWARLEYFRDRLYSMGLFTDVRFVLNSSSTVPGSYEVEYQVSERWYWMVYPVFSLRADPGKSWLNTSGIDNISYGLGYLNQNIAGRNIFLKTKFSLGFDRFFSFNISNPSPFFDRSLILSASFFFQSGDLNQKLGQESSQRKSDANTILVNGGVGYRLNPYSIIAGSLVYRQVVNNGLTTDPRAILLNPDGKIDQNAGFFMSWMTNTRNSSEMPMNGYLYFLSAGIYNELNSKSWFSGITGDARYYYPLNRHFSVAGLINHSLWIGPMIPYYHHSFVGRGDQIRGYQELLLQNTKRTLGSVELRTPVIQPNTIELDWVPVDEFKDFHWGLYGSLFMDAGYVNMPDSRFSSLQQVIASEGLTKYYDTPLISWGVSFNLLLPYSLNLKAEAALTTDGHSNIWISSGSVF